MSRPFDTTMREATDRMIAELERMIAGLRDGTARIDEIDIKKHHHREWLDGVRSIWHEDGTTIHVRVQVVGRGESRCERCHGVIETTDGFTVTSAGPFHDRCAR